MSIDVNPEDDFHVVIDGNVQCMSLESLDNWYQADIIEDSTLIWQQGLGEWMRLDVVLAELENAEPHAPASPLEEDIYFVLVAEGEVKQMSLDLLDDAFRLDVIDENTLVWQPGYTEWIPLRLLIGDEPVEHVSLMPSMAPSAPAASAPSVPPMSTPTYSFGPNLGISAPPVELSVLAQPPAASPWFSRSLVALSCLVVVFAMYRNGVGADAAAEFGQEQQLASLEEKVKKPGRDTPHGLQSWLAELETRYELNQLSETEPVPETPESKPSEASESEKVEKPDAAAKTEAAVEKPATKSEPKPDEAVNAFGAKLENKPAPAKRSAAPVRAYKKPSAHRLPSSGDPNDPMNGAL